MSEPPENIPQARDLRIVESSGLFDSDWYLSTYPEAEPDPLAGFCAAGWREGRRPNPYFDPVWYASVYGAEFFPGENPLLHYIRRGERENAWPSPHFDPEWYRDEYFIEQGTSPLQHYLRSRTGGLHSPLPGFDAAAWTQANPDCLDHGQDPYLHWLERSQSEENSPPVSGSPFAALVDAAGGNLELGDLPHAVPWETFKLALRLLIPYIPFDEEWYSAHYPDVAAAVKCGLITTAHAHFIDYGFFEGRSPAPRDRLIDS